MTEKSTRTTGNEPVEAIDPGGSRPGPGKKTVEQKVESGDRNAKTSSTIADANEPKPD